MFDCTAGRGDSVGSITEDPFMSAEANAGATELAPGGHIRLLPQTEWRLWMSRCETWRGSPSRLVAHITDGPAPELRAASQDNRVMPLEHDNLIGWLNPDARVRQLRT